MKVETTLFGSGALFFTPIAIIYGIVTNWHEPVGASALFLTAGLALLIGLYFWATSRRIDPRAEDDPFGEIATGAGEVGVFAPQSWWPLPLALSGALVFFGLAIAPWVCLVGLALGAIATVGWVYEFYRGEHAH